MSEIVVEVEHGIGEYFGSSNVSESRDGDYSKRKKDRERGEGEREGEKKREGERGREVEMMD